MPGPLQSAGRAGAMLCCLLVLGACEKVPINDINARFTLAESAWFEEEQTLFFFYRVEAQQGLGPDVQLEVSYLTDPFELPWTAAASLPTVHQHEAVDCGPKQLCGSLSLSVPAVPRRVGIRLRYHRDGALTLDSRVNQSVIGVGPAHTNRSLIVYGVFDERNTLVQWRARHQFPTLRNQEVQELGLRRAFRVLEQRHGALTPPGDENPYGYGFLPACPGGLLSLGFAAVGTSERAVFGPSELPLTAAASPLVCGRSIVTDAKGEFETAALAKKNPEVRSAFPLLRSPIALNTPVRFFLKFCNRTISDPHEAMQIQRLQLEDGQTVCIERFREAGFASELATIIRTRVDAVRPAGTDMVVTLGLHHDDRTGAVQLVVENALSDLLTSEGTKSSPRVSGAFVLDSISYDMALPALRRNVLRCPATLPGDDLLAFPSNAQRSCPLLPDQPALVLGPVSANQLPILPTRAQYLKFIGTFSAAQAGKTKSLEFRAPVRTPLSADVPLGEFGVATFFNNEVVTAEPSDAFSYCAPTELGASLIVFRVDPQLPPAPLSVLPSFHEAAPQANYGLGLAWDFPFLTRLEYEAVVAGAITAASFTVPFGIASVENAYYGNQLWETGEFNLEDVLLQCKRFCDHPTFDSAGVYNVLSPFRTTYLQQCYQPLYPLPDTVGGGFPLDP